MIVAVIVIGVVFAMSEVMHFRRENELIRRIASRNESEYQKNYVKEEKEPAPSPAKVAMKRWKSGGKDETV